MKKLIFSLLAMATLTFVGCSKDDDNLDYSLSGTEWVSHTSGSDWTSTATMTFSKTTFSTKIVDIIDGVTESPYGGDGTYQYEPPKIILTYMGESLVGTVDGNTITIGGEVFTKQ